MRDSDRGGKGAQRTSGDNAYGSVGADAYISFDTPENVVFGYEIAGIGSRFLAAVVDTVLIVLLQVIANLTLILVLAASVGDGSLSALEEIGGISLLGAVMGLAAFALLWGYYIFFEMLWNGQSPGKRWAGLRVIQRDGKPIDLFAALIRNLVRIIDFLPLYYGVGVLTMFADEKSRRLGDFAAGTLVVFDRGTVTLDVLEKEHARRYGATGVSSQEIDLPLERLDATHLALARRFLGRRQELHNRERLAILLATELREVMKLPQAQVTEQQALVLLETIAGSGKAPAD